MKDWLRSQHAVLSDAFIVAVRVKQDGVVANSYGRNEGVCETSACALAPQEKAQLGRLPPLPLTKGKPWNSPHNHRIPPEVGLVWCARQDFEQNGVAGDQFPA